MEATGSPTLPEQVQTGPSNSGTRLLVLLVLLVIAATWFFMGSLQMALIIALPVLLFLWMSAWFIRWMIRNFVPIAFGVVVASGGFWLNGHPQDASRAASAVYLKALEGLRSQRCREFPETCADAGSRFSWGRPRPTERTAGHGAFAARPSDQRLVAPSVDSTLNRYRSSPAESTYIRTADQPPGSFIQDERSDLGTTVPYFAEKKEDSGYYTDDGARLLSLARGKLCTATDPDFDGYRPPTVPHCRRHVSDGLKRQIKAAAGISPEDYGDYEIDHIIPLSIGGNNSSENLQALTHGMARDKSRYEQELFNQLLRGQVTQPEAILGILNWNR